MKFFTNLFLKLKCLSVLLLFILLLPVDVTAEVAEDQKKFYDILVISNPIQSSSKKSYLPLILTVN